MAVNREEAQKKFDQWDNGARIRNIAHQRAADYYNSRARALGLVVTIFTVIVGTSIFGSLSVSNNQDILIVVGLISLVAAILSGVNTFLNYSQLAAKHMEVGLAFGELRRRIDVIDCLESDDATIEKNLTEIEEKYDAILKGSVEPPTRFIDEAAKQVSEHPLE
jgi:hypothetical protein